MSAYQVNYFFKRGRGEQIRLLLAELGESWEEGHVTFDNFKALKAEGSKTLSFGSVPMLRDGDFKLSQGPVILNYLAQKHGIAPKDTKKAFLADSINMGAEDLRIAYFRLFGDEGEAKQAKFVEDRWVNRWLPSTEGLLKMNGTGFFVGDTLTHADIAVWDAIDAVLVWVKGANLDGFPLTQKFYDSIKARPKIAAYLSSDLRPEG